MSGLGIDWDAEDAAEQAARQPKTIKRQETVAVENAPANAIVPPTPATAQPMVAAPPPANKQNIQAPQSFAESIMRKIEPYVNPIHLKPGVTDFESYKDIDPYATIAHGAADFLAYQHGVKPILGGITQGVGNLISKSISGVDPTIKAQNNAKLAEIASNEKIAAMKYGQSQGPDRGAVATTVGRIEPTFDISPIPALQSMPDTPPVIKAAPETPLPKANPLDTYSQQNHGFTLAELEAASGGPLTKASDIDLVANSMKNGRGMTVNTLPGTVSNQPAGIPTTTSPMNQLTAGATPPAPIANAVPPQPVVNARNQAAEFRTRQLNPVPPPPPPSISETVANGGNVTKAVTQNLANDLDISNRSEKQIPVLKAQSAGVNQYLNMFGFQKKDPTSPRSLAAIEATNKLLEQGFQGVPPKGASGNPEGYRNQYIPFVENNANTLAPQTQEHLNKSRTKAQVATVDKLIQAGVPLSQQGKASIGALAATAGATAIPALAAAGYHAYKDNKEAVNAELKDAWHSMKSLVTMPIDVAKAAGKGDFGPFKDMLMSMNPGTLLMNEMNKRDESAIQRMIQAEKVGTGRGIAPPSAYFR